MTTSEINVRVAARLKLMTRALRYRNYQLFFFGQGTSVAGTWMQTTAMSWLVYRMTGSALLLGVVGFASQIPATIAAPLGGVIADRHNRRRILLVTQTLAMLQAAVLTTLVFTGMIQVWHIIALSILLGLINSFDVPTRQSFVVNMVEKKADLDNAIALNSMLFNSARFIGPSIAGILIALSDRYGEGICFLLNAVTYLAVIIALLAMKMPARGAVRPHRHVLHELWEGATYVWTHTSIRAVLLLLSALSLFAMAYAVLMPVFAKDILHGDSRTQGFLIGAGGAGALIGSIFLAARKSIAGIERVTVIAMMVFGIGLIAFSQSKWLFVSLPILVVTGFAGTTNMVACNTIVQTIVDDDKRGRLMSFWTLSWMGTAPFGSLLAGAMSELMGAPMAVTVAGTCAVLGALLFSRSLPALRRSLESSQAPAVPRPPVQPPGPMT